MKLLILGGTRFLGVHLVDAAIARGHDVTVFNRGLSRTEPVPGVENIRGDRDGGLAEGVPGDGTWDAVVDTSGYLPRIVGDSARFFANRTRLYVFISTISVYADFTKQGLTEDARLATTDEPSSEKRDGRTYGPLKALCEAEVLRAMPDRSLVIRPGLIVGPHDPTDRFTYWPLRAERGGVILAPSGPECPAQFIDARDLARWTIEMAERGAAGIYHATSQAGQYTLGQTLAACQAAASVESRVEWVPERFLQEQGVAPWMQVPLWVPEEQWGMLTVDCSRAFSAGLQLRPLSETVADTLAWAKSRGNVELRAGLSPECESELLAEWARSVQ